MKRWLYAHTVVEGEPDTLDELLRAWLPRLLHRATATPEEPPHADGSFVLHLSADLVGLSAGKEVRARIGVAERVDDRTRIAVTWAAEPARYVFPTFEGAVELQPLSQRHAELVIVGAYQVPLGVVGAALDGLTLRRVAERTVDGLAERVAAELERLAHAGPTGGGARDVGSPGPMTVQEVMTPDPVVFDEELSLRSAAHLLVSHGIQGAPVTGETGALLGVLSEQDLLEKEAPLSRMVRREVADVERRRAAVTVGEACSRPARVTVPNASLREAAGVMLDHGVARLVVVDHSAIVGIVTRHDVLKALLRSDAELQAAVDAAVADLGEPDVRAVVVWGEVTVDGTVSVRSQVTPVVRALEHLDGILAVRGEPGWREDDLLQRSRQVLGP